MLNSTPVLLAADDESDSLLVVRTFQLSIDRHHVSADLPDVRRLKFLYLDLNDIVPPFLYVVEQHVNHPFRIANLKLKLASHVGKAPAKFLKELFDVPDQLGFQFCLAVFP